MFHLPALYATLVRPRSCACNGLDSAEPTLCAGRAQFSHAGSITILIEGDLFVRSFAVRSADMVGVALVDATSASTGSPGCQRTLSQSSCAFANKQHHLEANSDLQRVVAYTCIVRRDHGARSIAVVGRSDAGCLQARSRLCRSERHDQVLCETFGSLNGCACAAPVPTIAEAAVWCHHHIG